jgi:DNA-directed RNA polymerase subunit RPC12/RpoP
MSKFSLKVVFFPCPRCKSPAQRVKGWFEQYSKYSGWYCENCGFREPALVKELDVFLGTLWNSEV